MLNFLLACLVALSVTVRADHVKDAPWIVSTKDGPNKCGENDPLGPCPSTILLIDNPLKYDVVAKLSCGMDLEQPTVTLPARTRTEVEVDSNIPSTTLSCQIESWSKKKK